MEEICNETRQQIGRQVKMHRAYENLRQDELANLCGLTRNQISKIERGDSNYSLDHLIKISQALKKELRIEIKNPE